MGQTQQFTQHFTASLNRVITYLAHFNIMSEGSLEVKLPTIWTGGKAVVGVRGKKIREEKRVRGKKMQVREKVVGKSRFTVFFQ